MSEKNSRDVKCFKMLEESAMGCSLIVLVIDLRTLQRTNIIPLTRQSFFCEFSFMNSLSFRSQEDVENTILVSFITSWSIQVLINATLATHPGNILGTRQLVEVLSQVSSQCYSNCMPCICGIMVSTSLQVFCQST